ncbi:putative ribonuclease H-like domain-containing protein [Tanacetum coccineum]
MTAPSTSSTNDVNTAKPAYEVSTVSPNVNTASSQVSIASFSDNVVNGFEVAALFANYEGKEAEVSTIHKMGHLPGRVVTPRNKEGQFRNQDNTRKQGNNEDTSSKAMLAIDGVGSDWSDMAEKQVYTNMALMAFSDSELNQTEFIATTYKRGLTTVEEQLITYRKNEVLFSEEVAVFKREVACKDYEINVLKIPPPRPLIYNRPKKLDLSYSGLYKFKEPEFKGYGFENSKQESSIVCDQKSDDSKENFDDSLVKEQISKDTSSFVEPSLNVHKETVFPVDKKVESVKPKNHEKPVKKSVRYAEMYRSQTPRGNQRNWNGKKSNQLGSDFVMNNKACFICGSFNHVQVQCKYHQKERMVYGNNYNMVNYNYTTKRTYPNAQRNMVPRVVLMKIGLKPFNTARTVNTAHPKSIVFSAKPMFTHKVNTAKAQAVNTARPQAVNTGRPKAVKTARPNSAVVNAVRVNQANGKPQQDDTGFVDSGCSRHMTGNIAYLSDFKEFDGGYVTFGGGAHGGRISGKGTLKTDSLDFEDFPDESILLKIPRKDNMYSFDMKNIVPKESLTCLDETSEILKNFIKEIENLVDTKVKIIRSNNGTEFKNKVIDDFCREKGIKREYSIARTPQQNGIAERRNMTLIEAARTMLADSKLPTTFWAEAVSTACYVQNRVLVVKPHNKAPYELFRGFKPALSFMRPFGCHVTILNTLDSLGKFDGKSDECFFVGYFLSSKAFRVYNTRTRRVEENLHIGFLENKPMIEGNGTQGEFSAGTSEEISQYCIVMPIWKDASYFDSPTQDVENGGPKSAADDQKQDGDGPDNENKEQEVNAVRQHVNTASLDVNTGSSKLNTVDPSVNTASSYDQDSPKDLFTIGASHTLKATHVEFFSDEDEPEVDLGNITNSYTVPTTPNTRIHKDHPIENVIGNVKSSVQTRRMTKPTSKQGFLSTVYEQKTHDTLNTCLYACFLSQIKPTSIAKALSDSSWVETMQEELLQFKLQQCWELYILNLVPLVILVSTDSCN